jgi:hypothetical protein
VNYFVWKVLRFQIFDAFLFFLAALNTGNSGGSVDILGGNTVGHSEKKCPYQHGSNSA